MKKLIIAALLAAVSITMLPSFVSNAKGNDTVLADIRDGVHTASFGIPIKDDFPEEIIIQRYSLSAYEEELLCRIAYAEAGNQGDYGMALIMAVIMNRVENPRFPNNVRDVIFAPSQFSTSHWFYEAPIEQIQPALDLLQSGAVDDHGALFFCTTSFRSGTYLFSYGEHNFYQ